MKESDLNVFGEAVKRHEPAVVFESIEGRIPADGFAGRWNCGRDQIIEFFADGLFPAGYGCDPLLDDGVSVSFGRLGIVTGEQAVLGRLGRGLSGHGDISYPDTPIAVAVAYSLA